jgi:hypothetical protein
VTGDELAVHIDPAIPDGQAWVGFGDTPPGTVWVRNEAGEIIRGRTPYLDPARTSELIKAARSKGLVADPARVTLPLQQPTLNALTRAFGGFGEAVRKTQVSIHTWLDLLGHRTGRNPRRSARRARQPRVIRPVPPIVPAGLSRVDSTRARSARSALLRSRRRAIRHNRALPPGPRARIFITDPKITWEDPKRAPSGDLVDATAFALNPGHPAD